VLRVDGKRTDPHRGASCQAGMFQMLEESSLATCKGRGKLFLTWPNCCVVTAEFPQLPVDPSAGVCFALSTIIAGGMRMVVAGELTVRSVSVIEATASPRATKTTFRLTSRAQVSSCRRRFPYAWAGTSSSLSAPRAPSRWILVGQDVLRRENAKYRATENDGEYGSRWNSRRLCLDGVRTALVKCERWG